jgi:malate dehydrogenase (oxaloacetate-decarboxylating)
VKIPEILQIEMPHAPGALASVLNALAETGQRDQDRTLLEIAVAIDIEAHAGLVGRLNALPSARFIGRSDRVFDRHRGGKIEMHSRVAISTQQLLRDIYTPNVAGVYRAIQAARRRRSTSPTLARRWQS